MKSQPASLVYVIDDNASVRRSITRLLEGRGLAAQPCSSAAEFLEMVQPRTKPTCLVLDVKMPKMDGLELQREMAARGLHLPIVFLTAHGDIPMSVRAMKGGAVNFIAKPFRAPDLIKAVEEALAQDALLRRKSATAATLARRARRLSPREREVFHHVAKGLPNKRIADLMFITERTVKAHRARVMEKLEARSVADLVQFALALGTIRGVAAAPPPRAS